MSSFDEMALAYDRSIDWDRRLAREIPFILKTLGDRQSARVLDLACGSGRHAIALAEQGHEVIGVDKSTTMINEAKSLAKGLDNPPEFIVANILDISPMTTGKFDLALCLGNSLALLETVDQVKQLIKTINGILTQEGAFVIQVLNFRSILRDGFAYFPIKGVYDSGEVRYLFARFFQHHKDKNYSTLVMTSFKKERNSWATVMASQNVLRLDKEILQEILSDCQFVTVEFYSNYHEHPLNQDKDRSIVVRAYKEHP